MNKTLALVVLVVLLATWAFAERRVLFMYAFSAAGTGESPTLLAPEDEGPDVRSAAQGLTDRPIVFLPSHFHYDHVGNQVTFDEIAVVDLPHIRNRVDEDGRLALLPMEHLGMAEGVEPPTWEVDHWWPPGKEIELGGRTLTLVYTPGHTTDSVSLLDETNQILFSGDYLYPGDLYGFLPNSSMADYHATALTLLGSLGPGTTLLGAHRVSPPGAPRLSYQDVKDLAAGLLRIRDGEVEGDGSYPVAFPINERLIMLAEPRWLQSW
jgi:glyoxylase-like metal-dependent hydrolase (beta-lactamase superfamily II)